MSDVNKRADAAFTQYMLSYTELASVLDEIRLGMAAKLIESESVTDALTVWFDGTFREHMMFTDEHLADEYVKEMLLRMEVAMGAIAELVGFELSNGQQETIAHAKTQLLGEE